MNHTLRTLLNSAPVEIREAFVSARAELSNPQSLAQYDKDMEDFLMEQKKKERVTERTPRQVACTKRVDALMTH